VPLLWRWGTDSPLDDGILNLDRDCLGYRKDGFRVARRNQRPQLGVASCENPLDQLGVPIGHSHVALVQGDGDETAIAFLP
jgi:hypothetical protein